MKVPLIVRWPGTLAPESVNRDLVSFVDLGPTLLSIAGIEIPEHMQGVPFLGPAKGLKRPYIFGARDRIDESYDGVRNLYPEKPYVLPVPYRDRGQTMQELLRLKGTGELSPVQRLWLSETRPAEELYDLVSAPHETENLIDRPELEPTAARLRRALEDWMQEIGDLKDIPESEMVETMWPCGSQPVTDRPILNPFGGTFSIPTEVSITRSTKGASIAYTVQPGENPSWRLYSEPIRLDSATQLRAKAVRYGYKESEEVRAEFIIKAQ